MKKDWRLGGWDNIKISIEGGQKYQYPLRIAPVFENSPGEIFDIWFPNLFNAGCVLG
nr:MAG TPA: hypothetical protein [Caudoviricetes sp.]